MNKNIDIQQYVQDFGTLNYLPCQYYCKRVTALRLRKK